VKPSRLSCTGKLEANDFDGRYFLEGCNAAIPQKLLRKVISSCPTIVKGGFYYSRQNTPCHIEGIYSGDEGYYHWDKIVRVSGR
jgi:hypothetical protein